MKRTDERIKELLVAYRMKKAPDAQFAVFNNQHMEELLKAKPKTLDEMSELKGFPRLGTRIKKYGADIVEIINGEDEVTEDSDTITKVKDYLASDSKNSQTFTGKAGSGKTTLVSAEVSDMNIFSNEVQKTQQVLANNASKIKLESALDKIDVKISNLDKK